MPTTLWTALGIIESHAPPLPDLGLLTYPAVRIVQRDGTTWTCPRLLVGPNCSGLVNPRAEVRLSGFLLGTHHVLVALFEDGDLIDDIGALMGADDLQRLSEMPSLDEMEDMRASLEQGVLLTPKPQTWGTEAPCA